MKRKIRIEVELSDDQLHRIGRTGLRENPRRPYTDKEEIARAKELFLATLLEKFQLDKEIAYP